MAAGASAIALLGLVSCAGIDDVDGEAPAQPGQPQPPVGPGAGPGKPQPYQADEVVAS